MADHVATVQQMYEAFGRGDVPAILAHLADGVAWEHREVDNYGQQAGVPWLVERCGRDGAAEFFASLQALRFHEFRVLGLMAGGSQVAAEVVVDVEVAGGGRFRDEEIHLWDFDAAGRVARFRHYVDTAKHIAAAGGRST